MLSREYNKRIDIYETTSVPDDFGGFTMYESILFSSWAKIQESGVGYKATDFGLTDFHDPVLFTVKSRSTFVYQGRTLFLVYKNEKYIIQGIRQIVNLDLEIFCSKESPIVYPEVTT